MDQALHQWVPFWPDTASNTGEVVNAIFIGLAAVAAFICLFNYGLVALFAVRYRQGSTADRTHRVQDTWHWEIGWTSATLFAFLLLFVWGAGAYVWLYQPPPIANEIFVVGKQWMWKIQHPDGVREINEVHVPLGQPVRLVMTSEDVIHSFFIPAFRIKHDVLPEMYETLWFKPTKVGEYRIFCAEFCGTEHALMRGKVVVMDSVAYQEWLTAQPPAASLARQGEALFRQLGCSGCHGANSAVHAPPLEGVYGRLVHLSDGSIVRADDRYIHDSIMLPESQIVAGYQPIMPSFAGQIGEDDVFKLIAYVKSLGESPRPVR
ncbi:MAG: cytochrome c oxidase subunit II [Alphaproteobacteria bacterium]|nr:cytochrome c oxidase subunit II [Alphaproteobacteria bacterium]